MVKDRAGGFGIRSVMHALWGAFGAATWWKSFKEKPWTEKCQEIRRLTHLGLGVSSGVMLICLMGYCFGREVDNRWLHVFGRTAWAMGAALFSLSGFAWAIQWFDRWRGFFEHWPFRAGGFVALICVGTFVYAVVPIVEDGNAVNAIFAATNRALSAFFRSQGGFEGLGTDLTVKAFCWDVVYYVYHLLVAIYLAGLTYSFFGREMMNALHLWCSRDDVAVIWGWSRRGELMAQDLIDNHAKEVLFHLEKDKRYDDAQKKPLLEKMSAMRKDGSVDSHPVLWDFVDFETVDKESARGVMHFFLSDSGLGNIKRADQVIKGLQDNALWVGSDEKPTKIYVRVESSADEEYFSTWVVEKEKDKRFEIVVIRESTVIAEKFVRDHPSEFDCEDPRFRVLLLGLGVNGANVLDRIIENSQWEGREFGVDVVERDVEKWNRYAYSRVQIKERYHVRRVQDSGEVGTVRFSKWLKEKIQNKTYDRIVACLGDDAASISFCLRLSQIYGNSGIVSRDSQGDVEYCQNEKTGDRLPKFNNKIPAGLVYVQVDEDERGGFFKKYSGQSNVEFFGTLEDVYRVDSIIDPTIEDVDRRLNWWYSNMRNSDENADLATEWRKATWFNRQSSRAAALGQEHLVRYLGYDIELNSGNKLHCDMHDSSDVFEELREKLADESRLAVLG